MSYKLPISFLILLATCAFASAQELRDTFRRVKSSVVIVRTGGEQSASIAGQADDGGVGSGVLISKDGKILTAAHVVQGGQPITIEFTDGQRLKAQIVESSTSADLALLQVDRVPEAAVAAKLGDSGRCGNRRRHFYRGSTIRSEQHADRRTVMRADPMKHAAEF